MGYSNTQKGYLLFDLATKSFFVNRDVVFHEHIFPFHFDSPPSSFFSSPPVFIPDSDFLSSPDPSGFASANVPSPNAQVHSSPSYSLPSPSSSSSSSPSSSSSSSPSSSSSSPSSSSSSSPSSSSSSPSVSLPSLHVSSIFVPSQPISRHSTRVTRPPH
ncbi:hypothetical protein HRI_004706900 [Hibiscus trionum]|uniref:Retroviral polymerase SH3-like domain-containing protein n=1 Tax=Hibiscus trionum TaxID=183268 RepID=A0A9W7MRT8_HIBTR|nr:hypothetical protein HRI_004706900 [Hibiscus trionum]